MLNRLEIENFRGFSQHSLPFSALTVIVGKNNAGKSTVVEALRLISLITERYQNLTYREPPAWSGLPRRFTGVSPSLRNFEINFDSIFHQYRGPSAKIKAEFKNGESITVYLESEDRVFAVIRDKSNKVVKSRHEAVEANIPGVAIMPQVTPVQKQEVILNEDYVRRSMSSHLASAHFRNQLLIYSKLFKSFQKTVEDTWPGVQVMELIAHSRLPGEPIFLEIRNDDFVAEVCAMGHGLQMWLQTMWFLTRSQRSPTIILDEPDVYMHADLQRKIIRFLKSGFPQVLLTTHSVEIMSEVQPQDILIIDRKSAQSAPATSVPAVQSLIDNVGSAHNIQFARLWSARKFILIEGEDLAILKQIQNTLFPDSEAPIDTIPNMQIGGWGGWPYVIGSTMMLKNALGQKVGTYCLLDSDYHTDTEINIRIREANEHGIQLYIWSRKEIESYLLIPTAIHRLIEKRIAKRTSAPTIIDVEKQLDTLASELEDIAFDGISAEILAKERQLGSGGANKRARFIIKDRKNNTGLLSIIPAKTLISKFSKWCQDEFGVMISPIAIAAELKQEEIPSEMRKFVTAIEYGTPV